MRTIDKINALAKMLPTVMTIIKEAGFPYEGLGEADKEQLEKCLAFGSAHDLGAQVTASKFLSLMEV